MVLRSFLEAVTAFKHFCGFLHATCTALNCLIVWLLICVQMDSGVLKFRAVLGPYIIVTSFARQEIFEACKYSKSPD